MVGALVYDVGLLVLRRVDRAFPSTDPTESTWWFGYARDLANLVAFLLFAAAFRILGLPTPMALLAGGVWVMGAYGLDYLFARVLMLRHPHRTLAIVMIVLAGFAAALRGPIEGGLEALVRSVF